MFRSFFLSRRWLPWSLLGTALILFATWYRVQLDVQINEWFGTFYDLMQKALGKPGAITMAEYWAQIATFFRIAMIYVTIAVVLDFFVKHYIFRWRTAMNDYYMEHWHKLRHIEGAAQRVQEDTMRFASIMESLGVDFMRSVMMLVAFLPILATLSAKITELPFFGAVSVFAGLGGDRLGAGGHGAAGCRRHHAARAAVPEPAGRGGVPQGTGVRRGRRDPRRRRRWRASCSATCAPTTSACSSTTSTSTSRSGRTCSSACWCPTSRWRPTVVGGVITLGVMQQIVRAFGARGKRVPVPGAQLEHDRRADVGLQAAARLRAQITR